MPYHGDHSGETQVREQGEEGKHGLYCGFIVISGERSGKDRMTRFGTGKFE